jgi:FkbM family methyltransferase
MIYSQNDEQTHIENYFSDKPIGKFLDVGGFHPFKFSNTRRLYEMGWGGTIAEPSPKCFKSFIDEYGKEERITLLNVAISDKDETMTFYESNGDAISTTDISHKQKWEKSAKVKYDEIEVEAISMENFIAKYSLGVEFISIDTESTNMKLFRLLPAFFLQQIKMICIEHDQNQKEIQDKLSGYGFSTLHINGENIILAK